MLQNAREYRIHCYRRMQLADMADDSYEDYSVQDYQQECAEASENAERLLGYIESHEKDMSPEEEAELLLAAFVAMNAGFRDHELSIRAFEIAEMLIPMLSDNSVKLHLLVYLYQESGDDREREEIERLMAMIEIGDLEEDRCLMNLYELMSEQYFAC